MIEIFAGEMQQRQTHAGGLLRSAIGKARGQALRLALLFEMLWWCGADGSSGLAAILEDASVVVSVSAAIRDTSRDVFLLSGHVGIPEYERLVLARAPGVPIERSQTAHSLVALDQKESAGVISGRPKGTMRGFDNEGRNIPRPCRPHGRRGLLVPIAV
jgi:hypothetical protein